MEKLVNIQLLSELTGLDVRTLRTLRTLRKIPCLKAGHRTMHFYPSKVIAALERYEVKAVA